MKADIKEIVRSCFECQARKKPNKLRGRLHTINVEKKFERVQIDLYFGIPRSNGFNTIMVVTDVLTKFVVVVPLTDKTAATVAQAFWTNWVSYFGFPNIVQTDRGSEFTSDLAAAFFYTAVDKVQSTAYHPQSQGECDVQRCGQLHQMGRSSDTQRHAGKPCGACE